MHQQLDLRVDQAAPGALWRVSNHPVDVYLNRLGSGSRRGQSQALDTMARLFSNGCRDSKSLDWASLSYSQTIALRRVLAERYAPNTTKRMLAALRGILKECWRLGLVSREQYTRTADVGAVKGELPTRGRALTGEELRCLFEVCEHDSSPAGVRDAAILGLLYGLGLRRSELIGLNVEDHSPEGDKVFIRGKGQAIRFGYLTEETGGLLSRWLRLRGLIPGPMFLPLTKSGHLVPQRLTTESIAQILKKRAAQAAVRPFSCHDLRRSFITHLLEAGVDIALVQRIAGHRQVSTTVLYDLRGEEAKVKAMELLRVPIG